MRRRSFLIQVSSFSRNRNQKSRLAFLRAGAGFVSTRAVRQDRGEFSAGHAAADFVVVRAPSELACDMASAADAGLGGGDGFFHCVHGAQSPGGVGSAVPTLLAGAGADFRSLVLVLPRQAVLSASTRLYL